MDGSQPHIMNVSYVHPADYYDGRDAGAVIRYLVRRPADKRNPSAGGWWSIPRELRVGDARAFTEAANERTRHACGFAKARGKGLSKNRAVWCTSYLHVLISPANRGELDPEQLTALAEVWTVDHHGETLPHFGAVHEDRNGKHLHVVIARDRIGREELKGLKTRTGGLAMELGRDRELVRQLSHEELSHEVRLGLGLDSER